LILNLIVAIVLPPVGNATASPGTDETRAEQYP
jgi:hypothetical protein